MTHVECEGHHVKEKLSIDTVIGVARGGPGAMASTIIILPFFVLRGGIPKKILLLV